jgi:hypothetical protein
MTRFATTARATFAWILLFLVNPGESRGEDTCVLCHVQQSERILSEPVAVLAKSAHAWREMSCADCHRGDPDEPTVRAHDVEGGFLGRPRREDIPGMCGGCHGDPTRIALLGGEIPTDQLDLFRRSGHGKALARGNTRSAVCVDCHGSHDVRGPDDPLSLMDPDSILPTCAGCHSDAEHMARSGWPLDQARRWRNSVHGKARVDENNDASPTCNGCHDAHGGITGLDDLAACTRCHARQEASFARSPHAKVFRRLGFASCVECHGSHDIQHPDAKMLGTDRRSACRRCHTQGEVEVLQEIDRIQVLREKAHGSLATARRALENARPERAESSEGQAVAEAIDLGRWQLSQVVHGFDEAGIEQVSASLEDLAVRASALAGDQDALADEVGLGRVGLPAFVVLVFLGATLVVWRTLRPRSLSSRQARGAPR